MSAMNIELVTGDIRKFKADVCVSSIHMSKDLRRWPLSKQILEAAGQELQDGLLSKSPQSNLAHGWVVETEPWGLTNYFKHIFFVCLHKWQEGNEKDLQTAIDRVLVQAAKKNASSIVIPPLGVGGQYPAEKVALAILQAVIAYSWDHPRSSITSVKIVLLHQKEVMLKAFVDLLHEGMNVYEDSNQNGTNAEGEATAPQEGLASQGRRTGQKSIFSKPLKNLWSRLSSYLGYPMQYRFLIGPVQVGLGPHVNVQPCTRSIDFTIGLTISVGIGVFPAVIAKKLKSMF